MIYVFLALLSYTCTYYLVGLLIQGQLADVAEGLATGPMPRHPASTCVQSRPMRAAPIGSTP